MQIRFTSFLLFLLTQAFGQTPQLDKIEVVIKKNSISGTFDKKEIDLNNDGKQDIIYLYQCGEPKCIEVFLNNGKSYEKLIAEQCSGYDLWNIDDKKILHLRLYQCCGESPYFSNRLFEFSQTAANLKENYVLTNEEYTDKEHLITPFVYSTNQYYVKVTIDNYNLRFSPTIEKLEGKTKENFTFACEDGTNIIAKIKINSRVKVLSELVEKERKWLFVEIEKEALAGKCNPIDFDFKDQKLRGWISDKYVSRE